MLSRHLSDASHRDLYESAHSVILAILASSALPVNSEIRDTSNANSISDPDSANFVTRIIPFYAQCLIEVSYLLSFAVTARDETNLLVCRIQETES